MSAAGTPGEGDPVPDDGDELDEASRQRLATAREVARGGGGGDDWPEVAASIKHRVRTVIVPSRPVLSWDAQGRRVLDAKGTQVTVASRDVVVLLRRRLQSDRFVADDVDLDIEDHRLARARVDVVGRYGIPLPVLMDAVWALVRDTLLDQVGADPDFEPDRDLQVRVVDIVDGDPRTT